MMGAYFSPVPWFSWCSFCLVCVCASQLLCVVDWPLSDGLFSLKWRHKEGGVCECMCVCAHLLEKKKRGSWSKLRWGATLPCNYAPLLHLPPLNSSPILRLLPHILLNSHSAAAPSRAAGGGNLCLSHCSNCLHSTELKAGRLLPNITGFTSQTAQPPRMLKEQLGKHTQENTLYCCVLNFVLPLAAGIDVKLQENVWLCFKKNFMYIGLSRNVFDVGKVWLLFSLDLIVFFILIKWAIYTLECLLHLVRCHSLVSYHPVKRCRFQGSGWFRPVPKFEMCVINVRVSQIAQIHSFKV